MEKKNDPRIISTNPSFPNKNSDNFNSEDRVHRLRPFDPKMRHPDNSLKWKFKTKKKKYCNKETHPLLHLSFLSEILMSHGRHSMLLFLSFPPASSNFIDVEANKFYDIGFISCMMLHS